MIQRIQSIWLLLASLTLLTLLFVPLVTSSVGGVDYYIIVRGLFQKTADASKEVAAYWPLFISAVAVAAMCFANIFNFRKREVQKRIVMATVVLIIGLSFWCSQYAKKIPGGLENANYKAGMFLPLVAIFFCVLALRGINNDEKLLKSADRLR